MAEDFQHRFYTPAEMGAVDQAAASSGLSSFGLMLRAGEAVAAAALKHFPQTRRFVVLCGPGNNGGDGYVAANALINSGCKVLVCTLGDRKALAGDAKIASERCGCKDIPLEHFEPVSGDLIVDALFGAGLTRDVPEVVIDTFAKIRLAGLPVLAVDLPSGLCGRRGVVLGDALASNLTVTFMARKPGHVLLPGRDLCGRIEVFDIGIPSRVMTSVPVSVQENAPVFWSHMLPGMNSASHKFTRGHLGVFSGPAVSTGAARMSALAGLKAGAGLVTMAVPAEALNNVASHLTAVMMKPVDSDDDLESWIDDKRISAFILGPGFGIGEKARSFVKHLNERKLVLDADGISSFAKDPQTLFDLFKSGEARLVMTPHEGEFGRLFADLHADPTLSKVEKAVQASQRSNAVIVYKGADTVIAAPDGRAFINTNAPPQLATAGSGDVLAGIIGGLMAQGVPAFEAAAAGVWFHGRAGHKAGKNLTAEDLVLAVDTNL